MPVNLLGLAMPEGEGYVLGSMKIWSEGGMVFFELFDDTGRCVNEAQLEQKYFAPGHSITLNFPRKLK